MAKRKFSVWAVARREAKWMVKNGYPPMVDSGKYFLSLLDDKTKTTPKLKKYAQLICDEFMKFQSPVGKAGVMMEAQGWQCMAICAMFGMKDVPSTISVLIPRKNGKTTFSAAMGILAVEHSIENQPRVFIFANTIKQAKEAHDNATQMLTHIGRGTRNPRYGVERFIKERKWRCGQDSLEFAANMGVLQRRAADKENVLGLNASLLIIDEAALIDQDVYGSLMTGSTAARDWQRTLCISTAGRNIDAAYKNQIETTLMSISKGEEPPTIPILYCPNPNRKDVPDIDDRKAWKILNPGMRTGLVSIKDIESEFKYFSTTKDDSSFETFKMNIWGQSPSDTLATDEEIKVICQDFDEDVFLRNKCSIGLDTGVSSALSALCLLCKEGDTYYAKIKHFVSAEEHKRRYMAGLTWLDGEVRDKQMIIDGDLRQEHNHLWNTVVDWDSKYKIFKVTWDEALLNLRVSDKMKSHFADLGELVRPRRSSKAAYTNSLLQVIRDKSIRVGKNASMISELQNGMTIPYEEWTDITKAHSKSNHTVDGLYAIMYALRPYQEDDNSLPFDLLTSFSS